MTVANGRWTGTMSGRLIRRSCWQVLLLALILCASLCVSGCGQSPPTDANGNLPDDVVRRFVELVQAKDYQSAERLWYGPSKLVFQSSDPREGVVNSSKPFEDFCAEFMRIDLATANISKARAGKAGFWVVAIAWKEENNPSRKLFGLKIVDDEWKMERGYYW